jgi:hypothetical protein
MFIASPSHEKEPKRSCPSPHCRRSRSPRGSCRTPAVWTPRSVRARQASGRRPITLKGSGGSDPSIYLLLPREASITSRKARDHIAGHPVMSGLPRSATGPDPGSHHLQAGCRSGRAPGLRPNSPRRRPLPSPRFRHRPVNFGTPSAVRLRSSLRISPDGIKSRLFCDAHHERF